MHRVNTASWHRWAGLNQNWTEKRANLQRRSVRTQRLDFWSERRLKSSSERTDGVRGGERRHKHQRRRWERGGRVCGMMGITDRTEVCVCVCVWQLYIVRWSYLLLQSQWSWPDSVWTPQTHGSVWCSVSSKLIHQPWEQHCSKTLECDCFLSLFFSSQTRWCVLFFLLSSKKNE